MGGGLTSSHQTPRCDKSPAGGQRAERSQPSVPTVTVTGARAADLLRQSFGIKRHTAGLIRPQREEGAEDLTAAGLQPWTDIHIFI